jgi:hypothetical protein
MLKNIFLCLWIVNVAFSYAPSADMLFRHSGNAGYSASSTAVQLKIKELATQKIFFSKIIFSELEKKSYLEIAYYEKSFAESELTGAVKFADLTLNSLKSSDEMSMLFYSIMQMYLRNMNSLMLETFQKMGIGIKNTAKTINPDKKKLLEQYLSYARRKAKHRAGDGDSPFFTTDPAKKIATENLMSESFYNNQIPAVLLKVGNKFVWQVEKDGLKAQFDQVSRRMTLLEYSNREKRLTFVPLDVLFFGPFVIPRKMVVSENDIPKYDIEFSDASSFSDQLSSWSTRFAQWEKLSSSKNKQALFSQLPSFLLH